MPGYLFLIGFILLVLAVFFVLPSAVRVGRVKRLRKSGTEAGAIVLESTQIGGSQFRALVELKLLVKPAGAPEFETKASAAVPHAKLHGIRPGMKVPVLYNPADVRELIVDVEGL